MKYDFTSVIDRRGLDAIAVDAPGRPGVNAPGAPMDGFDIIPMWIADMNFATAPAVTEAILRRAAHPLYGYFLPREEYFSAILTWQRERHGVQDLRQEHIGYQNGVLGGVVSALRLFCSPGDAVLVHSPTYIGFTSALTNNGWRIVRSPLVQDAGGVWRMDFADMEKKLAGQHIHAAIFCSPHNPCGRVWEDWELERAMALFQKYDVSVVSDEIWSDIVRPGLRHVPTQSVSPDARDRTVALYAPSKTFNLAGLVGSYHIIYNPRLRDRMAHQARLSGYNHQNLLSMYALIGAYSPQGMEWTDELCRVIADNVDYAMAYIAQKFEGVRCARPEGTYMLFPDCSGWCAAHGKTLDDVLRAAWQVGADVQDGRAFHGPCHLRMNLALPRVRLEEAMDRLDRYVFNGNPPQ